MFTRPGFPSFSSFFFLAGDQKSKDEAFGLMAGPNTPEGRRICVFGVGVSLPAAAQDHLQNYW